jgi:hypothetical protein
MATVPEDVEILWSIAADPEGNQHLWPVATVPEGVQNLWTIWRYDLKSPQALISILTERVDLATPLVDGQTNWCTLAPLCTVYSPCI